MTLQTIQEKYIGKRLNLYLIDGEEVTLDKNGILTFCFKSELFDDEALEVTNSLCHARLQLDGEKMVLDIFSLSCQRELELSEEETLFFEDTPGEDDYLALHYALMCAVIRE
jgi:hypothetical protein